MRINRSIFSNLERKIQDRRPSILLGARQVGKSTLLRMLQEASQKLGRSTRFYDLESTSDLEALSGSDKKVIETITSSAEVVLIDEFHYLKNASKLFKAAYDGGAKTKIFASGSSSLAIHKHLKESLAGRFHKTMIFPLTYEEFLRAPEKNLAEYLQWGGLPGLIHEPTDGARAALLDNIVSTYLQKDIKALIQEENIRAFNSLLHLLAQNQGSVTVVSGLAREVGLTEVTIARHLEIMAQTYVCHPVTSFSTNLANELKKSKKYYLFDLGIRNSLLKDFRDHRDRPDKGALYESFVFLQLLPQLKPNMEIRFWRTKKGDEVDFILVKNRVPVPVEVKSSLESAQVPSGMQRFLKLYPKAPFGVVFNERLQAETECEGRKVFFKPLPEAGFVLYLKDVV